MIKLAKVIDKDSAKVSLAQGTDTDWFISQGYSKLEVKQSDIDFDWYLAEKCPMKTDEQKAQERETIFNKEFFLTSLGYIRRKVSMATGDTKDFLADLLPTISMAVQLGQEVSIITYKKPDFTKEFTLEYMESLQEIKNVTTAFVQECALQVSKDFMPVPLTTK